MKYQFVILSLLFSCCTKAQKIFKVIEVERSALFRSKGTNNTANKYFRIACSFDSGKVSATYPIEFSKGIDTLKAIDELLKYKGDRRICALPIMAYNPAISQNYIGKESTYSIQVEALFIVNQLVYAKPFNYSPYPILVDKNTNKTYSINGVAISAAFQAYAKWYQKLKEKGIAYIKEKSILPLDGTAVRWF